MTATLDETLAGADMVGGEVFCDDLYNNLKNHWRANYGGDPCASGGLDYPQPGMIISDSYDDRLYHITLISGCPCSEIVQACVPLSDDKEIGFGNDWDGQLGYDELVNDALLMGIPIGGTHRGLIICDQADIVPAVAGIVGAITQPSVFILDADLDTYVGIGQQADDKPGIWSGPTNATPLAIQYEANADVTFFENTAADVNRVVYIYGSEDIIRLSSLDAGGFGLRIDAYQDNVTILTGLLRGAYIQASNGNRDSPAGTIRALELKARAGKPGETGANIHHLEGLSISADAKAYDVTLVMRGAEFILDGGDGASITHAVGLRIAQNFQADMGGTCYGLEFYWDSFEWDADIALASGGLIGGKNGDLKIASAGNVEIASDGIGDDVRGLSSIYILSAGKSDGIALYAEGHIGPINTDGPTYGGGIWLNIDNGAALGADVRALDIGIYERDANCTGGNAYGLAIHMDFDAASPPAGIYPFRLNCEISGATPDALIFAANKEALGLVIANPGTPSDAYLKIKLQDGSVYRIPLVKEP